MGSRFSPLGVAIAASLVGGLALVETLSSLKPSHPAVPAITYEHRDERPSPSDEAVLESPSRSTPLLVRAPVAKPSRPLSLGDTSAYDAPMRRAGQSIEVRLLSSGRGVNYRAWDGELLALGSDGLPQRAIDGFPSGPSTRLSLAPRGRKLPSADRGWELSAGVTAVDLLKRSSPSARWTASVTPAVSGDAREFSRPREAPGGTFIERLLQGQRGDF
jgi:hypothetical protein